MNDKEKLEIWKRKLVEIENKVEKLNNYQNILINSLNEAKTRQNTKLNNSLKGLNLEEEFLHLKDWIEFYEENVAKYKTKIEAVEKELPKQEPKIVKKEVKLEEVEEKRQERQEIKEEIKAEYKEKSEEELVKQELEDLDKESKKIAEKEKELSQKDPVKETFEIEIPSVEELERESKEEIKKEIEDVENEEKPEIKTKEKVKVEKKQPIEKAKAVEEEKSAKIEELWKKEEESIEELWRKEKPKIEVGEKEVRKQIKELFEGPKGIRKLVKFREQIGAIKEPITNIFEAAKLNNNKLALYGVPIILLLLITGVLFVSKPGITGYITLTKEETYADNLNLIINESGNYTWTPSNIGDIKDIKASGKVKGNGTVKIYIEKDGERYLIFDNKASD